MKSGMHGFWLGRTGIENEKRTQIEQMKVLYHFSIHNLAHTHTILERKCRRRLMNVVNVVR